MSDFTPKPPAPAFHDRELGHVLVGIGFAAAGIGIGMFFIASALLAVIR